MLPTLRRLIDKTLSSNNDVLALPTSFHNSIITIIANLKALFVIRTSQICTVD
jgi:hypothetical protein